MAERLLVVTVGPVTLKLPVSISYKHYSEQEIEVALRKIGEAFGDSSPYLEDIVERSE